MTDLRILGKLPADLVDPTRHLLDRAFGGEFSDDDWDHAQGGVHAFLADDDNVLAHASVVTRDIRIDGRWFRAGYVEAVACEPGMHGRKLGSQVVGAVTDIIQDRNELGVLSTAVHGFYERLGWERWQGTSWVLDGGGVHRTEDDDDGLMVLRTGPSAAVALDGEIACLARTGDHW